ncbi:c-type cytochrome [Calditrichota bacterium]
MISLLLILTITSIFFNNSHLAQLVHSSQTAHTKPGVTVEYGNYLTSGCVSCHGSDYTGGPIVGGEPGWPPSANLTPDSLVGLGDWSKADFFAALRTGKRPDGRELDLVMHRMTVGEMSDDELSAIWMFLQSLPAVGSR